MLIISDNLKKDIEKILVATRSLRRVAMCYEKLSEGQLQKTAYACDEIAFSALVAASEVESLKDQENKLIQKEVVSCLNQIAYQCLDVQEWQNSDTVRALLLALHAPCAYIARNVGLPELESDAELGLVLIEKDEEYSPLVAITEGSEHEQIEKLKAEIAALREILTSLIMERDHLRNVVCPEIEAMYLREVGYLEAELFHAKYEARLLKRTLELMQAYINRGEPVNVAEILETVHEEEAQYQAYYDELYEKATAAAAAAKTEQTSEGTKEPGALTQEELDEKALCKKLYRKIVKAMHPDLHPDQDEVTRDLFKKANVAYEQGDLKTLQEIASMLDGDAQEQAEMLLDGLKKERDQLREMIKALRNEIEEIKSDYPYTKKELLDDPERLATQKEKLKKELEEERQKVSRFKKRIMEMEKQWKN